MRFAYHTGRLLLIVTLLSGIAGCSRDSGPSVDSVPVATNESLLQTSMLMEEDARGTWISGIASLREGLISPDPALQRLAVRGIGRLEDPELIPLTLPLLFSDDETVRAEAINALGQAAIGTLGDEVAEVLLEHLVREPQEGPVVRAAIGRTLGRLRYADAGRFRRAEEALVELTREANGDAPLVALTGAILGLESMARRTGRDRMSEASIERLSELSALGRVAGAEGSSAQARVRRVAMLALLSIGGLGSDVLAGALRDPDPDVRRVAVMIVGSSSAAEAAPELLIDALSDSVPRVRVEAVRAFAARAPEAQECPLLLNSSRDNDLHIALVALDLLQQPCEDRGAQDEILTGLAAGLETAGPLDWHRGAGALVSLAVVSPEAALPLLDRAARSGNPFVRMYVARAATTMGSTDVLEALVMDPSANVRTVAIQGLFGLEGHATDSLLVAQLAEDDPQLLLTVAELLEGTSNRAGTVEALLGALARLSLGQLETARDPRMALLARIGEVGGAAQAAELEPYLNDYDSVVAARAAAVLTDWTGVTPEPQPRPLAGQTPPSAEEIARLAGTRVVLEMARGGEIEIRLLAEDAPTNAARFERLAASGYFNGLTFHRVVTNFVVQGGSPGDNEYAGADQYTRDEVGLVSHWRGTVGTSTRGRDTGDGQIFINLVDNLQLDHEYTVFGEVVSGMEVVDRVAEGDVIVRATVVVE